MYEKQNKHYAFNVFPEHNVQNVIFRFLFIYAKEEFIFLLFTFLLMNGLGKQAVSPGSIKQRLCCFLVYVF